MVDGFLCPDIWLGLLIQSKRIMRREYEWQLFSLSWKGISELCVASLNLCAAFYIFAGVMDMGFSLTLQWVSVVWCSAHRSLATVFNQSNKKADETQTRDASNANDTNYSDIFWEKRTQIQKEQKWPETGNSFIPES